jgi:hypothetical protein
MTRKNDDERIARARARGLPDTATWKEIGAADRKALDDDVDDLIESATNRKTEPKLPN